MNWPKNWVSPHNWAAALALLLLFPLTGCVQPETQAGSSCQEPVEVTVINASRQSNGWVLQATACNPGPPRTYVPGHGYCPSSWELEVLVEEIWRHGDVPYGAHPTAGACAEPEPTPWTVEEIVRQDIHWDGRYYSLQGMKPAPPPLVVRLSLAHGVDSWNAERSYSPEILL
jgi:hypothetical protein